MKLPKTLSLILLVLIFQIGCSKYTVIENLTYKSVDGLELKGDIYKPKLPGIKPAVLVVHGGWWAKRSGDMEYICKDLARSGFVAFNITYRLAPKNLYPKSVEDVRDAILWLKKNAAKFEVDEKQISAWGYSAGANLILLAGLDPELGLKALVAGGAPADLTVWPKSPYIRDFIGATFAEKPEIWKDASPVNKVGANSPPVFLYHGAQDDLVEPDQVDRMVAALKEKKVHFNYYKAPYLGHVATYLLSQKSIALGVQFIRDQMKP
jgi:acetyl esterase/lipase